MQLSIAISLGRAGIAAALARARSRLAARLSAALGAAFWSCMPVRLAASLARLPWRIGREAARDRARARTWRENQRKLLGVAPRQGYAALVRRRLVLESAMYHTESGLVGMLEACAAELAMARENMVAQGFTPVFAPLHVCSDALAVAVISLVPPRRTHTISIYAAGHYGADEAAAFARRDAVMIQHHPDEPAAARRAMLREMRANHANLAIFPDILPQFTEAHLGRAMRTHPVTLFGRPARLHGGAGELARLVGGRLIPFYVFWEGGRLAIRVFPPCVDGNDVARCLEQALREHGDQWLLWHFPSLFYFNDGGQ
ncbi:lysophospholipid acyltransferase family protein [Cupriavidus agavae]|uniref:Uncharacterized protein n=1 Tax=Cupriavidus agavae TaxID=1001822 RepID=A0A4Q7S7N5_9BURK|nr:hypothetical protein [Cupriavidus agavae]RZT42385.1 hypothetical protein EV147_1416 [Cupriavidus agavae]